VFEPYKHGKRVSIRSDMATLVDRSGLLAVRRPAAFLLLDHQQLFDAILQQMQLLVERLVCLSDRQRLAPVQ